MGDGWQWQYSVNQYSVISKAVFSKGLLTDFAGFRITFHVLRFTFLLITFYVSIIRNQS